MLTESDFPTVEEIAAWLAHIPARVESHMVESDDDTPHIDVRLQVEEDGTWRMHSGAACYDLDSRGYWGDAWVTAADGPEELTETAKQLREDAMESACEWGDMEDA